MNIHKSIHDYLFLSCQASLELVLVADVPMLLFPVEARSHGRLIGQRADRGGHQAQQCQAMAAPGDQRWWETQGKRAM